MSNKRTDGYQVDRQEFLDAHDKVQELLDGIFGTDFEGSSNVQFVLVDRQRCWPMHYEPELYDHDCETEDDYLGMIGTVLFNLRVASDKMNIVIKKREFWVKDRKL